MMKQFGNYGPLFFAVAILFSLLCPDYAWAFNDFILLPFFMFFYFVLVFGCAGILCFCLNIKFFQSRKTTFVTSLIILTVACVHLYWIFTERADFFEEWFIYHFVITPLLLFCLVAPYAQYKYLRAQKHPWCKFWGYDWLVPCAVLMIPVFIYLNCGPFLNEQQQNKNSMMSLIKNLDSYDIEIYHTASTGFSGWRHPENYFMGRKILENLKLNDDKLKRKFLSKVKGVSYLPFVHLPSAAEKGAPAYFGIKAEKNQSSYDLLYNFSDGHVKIQRADNKDMTKIVKIKINRADNLRECFKEMLPRKPVRK